MNNKEAIDRLSTICNSFVRNVEFARGLEGMASDALIEMQRDYIQALRYAIAVLTTKEAEES